MEGKQRCVLRRGDERLLEIVKFEVDLSLARHFLSRSTTSEHTRSMTTSQVMYSAVVPYASTVKISTVILRLIHSSPFLLLLPSSDLSGAQIDTISYTTGQGSMYAVWSVPSMKGK